jgi:iron complex outermembrane receptor protein
LFALRIHTLRKIEMRALLLVAAYAISTGAAIPAGTRSPAETPAIVGTITDSLGAKLGNVQVVLTPLNRSATTNDEGVFVLRGLPSGAYHVRSLLIGFAPGHADVRLPVSGPDVRVTIVMRRTPLQLSAVQVTATPTATDARDIAQSTVDLSGQALTQTLGASVAQTLSREPGISERFAGPAANTPVIRGLSGERILVLQDGGRTGDLSSTSSDHALSIDPLTAQRIEVVRGPASLLYGNNALGGVVNVISNDIPTQIPSHLDGSVSTQVESATPGGAVSAGITVPLNDHVAIMARGSGRHVDDMRQGGGAALANSFYQNFSGAGGLAFGADRASGGVIYRTYDFKYGLPSSPTADETGVSIRGRRHEINGRSDFSLGDVVPGISSVNVRGTANWYTHDEVESDGAIATTFNLNTQTADVLAHTQLGRMTGALGTSLLLRQYQATGEEALTPAANSNSAGAFIYEEIPIRDAADPDAHVPRLQLGGRYDVYRIDSKTGDAKFGAGRSLDFNNVSGSIGVTLPLTNALTATLSAARAFRAPTVEELFSNAFHAANGTYDRGNATLRSETSRGFDGSLRIETGKINGQIAGYYNTVANFITPDIVRDTAIAGDDGEDITVPLNVFSQSDATLKGIEGRLEGEVARHIVLGATGDVVRGSLRGGSPLPFMPAARLGALARYDDGHLSVNGDVRHAFAQNRVPGAATADDPSALATSAYTLVNVGMGYAFVGGGRTNALTLRIDNVLDRRYRDATSRIKTFALNPGRNLSLIYKVLF